MLLFDTNLSNTQISLILLKGPCYLGNFQGESPLSDHLSSISCVGTLINKNKLTLSTEILAKRKIVKKTTENK